MKKLISILTCICILFSSLIVADAAVKYDYSTGGVNTFSLTDEYVVSAANADVSGTFIDFSANGSVTFNWYLPFNSEKIIINYSSTSNAVLTVEGARTYEIALDKASKEAVYTFDVMERGGDRTFTFKTDKPVSIDKITFDKEKVPVPTAKLHAPTTSEIDQTLETAVIIDTKASAIMVNNQRRYINLDDVTEVPLNINGTVYLPSEVLAYAFGYYLEDYVDLNYLLLRKEPYEFIFSDKGNFAQKDLGEYLPIEDKVVYKDGRSFLPVRFFAEAVGETVIYQDGLIVCDQRLLAQEIINNAFSIATARTTLKEFYPKESSAGKIYYVAQTENASDKNNGSVLAPFKTLEKAGQVAKAGDTVIIREGVYREVLKVKNNGKPTQPIIFKAAEGENVTISANEVLDNLTPSETMKGVYTTNIDWDLGDGRNQLFCNDISLFEARYPNGPGFLSKPDGTSSLSYMFGVRGDIHVTKGPDGQDSIAVSDTLLDQEDDYWKGGYLNSLHGTGYAQACAEITGSTKGQLNLMGKRSLRWWQDSSKDNGWNYAYITGHINCLDIPNEWIIEDGVCYVIPPEGIDVATTKIEAKKRQLVIDIADNKYVQIKGIKTVGGGVRMNNSEMCMLDNMNITYLSHYTFGNDQREGWIDDRNIEDPNGAPPRGEMGIYVGGTDNIITNNRIDHSAASAVFGVGVYTYIANNRISNCGYNASYVSSLNFNTEAWKPQSTERGGHAIYNNTIYNAGRSLLNVSTAEGSKNYSGVCYYIPFDVAFNDFHDGMLSSLDTGLTYEYYCNLGNDKLKSAYRNNYYYYTSDEANDNPFSFGIYHDGGSQNIDTSGNLVFSTELNTGFGNPIYTQPLDIAIAYHNCWNNKVLGVVEGGLKNLQDSHFPQSKPYYAGTYIDSERFMRNYDKLINNSDLNEALKKENVYQASEGIAHNGAKIEDGAIVFSGNGQYVEFKDVDFKELYNAINIEFSGDKYNTNDVIEIIIGDSIETGAVFEKSLETKAPEIGMWDCAGYGLASFNGKQNLYIRAKDYKSAKIYSFKIYPHLVDVTYGAKLYGGNFTSFDVSKKVGNEEFPPTPVFNVKGDPLNAMCRNTWAGTTLTYTAVEFLYDVDILVMQLSSGGSYGGQQYEIRIDDLNSEPIFKGREQDGNWTIYTKRYFKLDKPVTKGKHTVYLTFLTDDGYEKTSNFYLMGFKDFEKLTSGEKLKIQGVTDIPEPPYETTVFGGKFAGFDVEKKTDNLEFDPEAYYDTERDLYNPMLRNTWPGTTINYEGIDFKYDVDTLILSASSGDSYAGQPYEIRIDSLDSKPILTGYMESKDWGDYTPKTYKLKQTIPQGKHNVYITFTDEMGNTKSSNIYYIGFESSAKLK